MSIATGSCTCDPFGMDEAHGTLATTSRTETFVLSTGTELQTCKFGFAGAISLLQKHKYGEVIRVDQREEGCSCAC